MQNINDQKENKEQAEQPAEDKLKLFSYSAHTYGSKDLQDVVTDKDKNKTISLSKQEAKDLFSNNDALSKQVDKLKAFM